MTQLGQQNVQQLRKEDLLLIVQNGQEKKLTVQALIDYITQATADMATHVDLDIAQAVMQAKVDEKADIVSLAMMFDSYVLKTTYNAGIALKQDKLAIPKAAIADPSAIATANVLGVTVAIGAGVNDLRTTVVAILNAARSIGLISP